MWIVCMADNSHEMSFIFSESWKKYHKTKKKIKMTSAAIVTGILGIKSVKANNHTPIKKIAGNGMRQGLLNTKQKYDKRSGKEFLESGSHLNVVPYI